MALPNTSGGDALLEARGVLVVEPSGPGPDVLEAVPRDQAADIVLGLGEVLVGVETHRVEGAVLVDSGAGAGTVIERHQQLHELVDVAPRQLTRFEDAGAVEALVHLSHHHQPVDHPTVAAQTELSVFVSDGRDTEIDVGCQAAVQLDLGAAEFFAAVERREVEEAEVDRLLQLVGALAGEEDRGDVRLHELDPLHPGTIERRPTQCRDE